MTGGAELETDYLVVGAGTAGMGFVDALIDETDADVIMLDRRPGPGGHWLECYPFVQLHQPSMNYAVGSSSLGHDRVEPGGRDTGSAPSRVSFTTSRRSPSATRSTRSSGDWSSTK